MQEILAYLAHVRTDVAACVEGNPSEAFARRPREDAWSGSQIIYHLGNVEGATSKMLEGLFASALAGGMPMDTGTGSLLHSLDHLHVPDRSARPIVAPERLRPPDNPDLAPSWASLQTVRERTHRAVATVEGRDLTTLSAPHPIFGPINGYEWVLFIGQHEERHLNQLKEALLR